MTFARWIGTCVCGKRCYDSKAEAKRAARQIRGKRGGRLDVYRCDHDRRYWHIGHPPPALSRGEIARADVVSQIRRSEP